MKKLAVDLVILPPPPVMDLVTEWNRSLCRSRPSNLVLDKINYLPHVTLAMGCLSENQLDHATRVLQTIASDYRTLELHGHGIRTVNTPPDSIVTLDIDLSPELASLHKSIVIEFTPLLGQNAVDSDLYDAPPVSQSSLDWINQFIPHSCFEHFWPHITLGFGEAPEDFRPISFQASRLALCHLGNHCTCRKVLGEAFLNSSSQ